MKYSNEQVAKVFEEMYNILSILGEDHFRTRSYLLASQRIRNLSEPLADVISRGDKIPGVGTGLLKKAKEILETGTCSERESLRFEVPDSALAILRIPGVGPKTVAHLLFQCGVGSLDELEQKLKSDTSTLQLSPKMIEKIKMGLPLAREAPSRFSLGYALRVLSELERALRATCPIEKLSVAGSVRRFKSTVRDGDLLVVAPDTAVPMIMNSFITHSLVYSVSGQGDTKASIRTREGFQCDLRVVAKESWGAALCYFTGSKAHNVRLRALALEKDPPLHINEYEIATKEGTRLGGANEEDLFQILGVQFIPPELREDTGEVELAQQFKLPRLLGPDELRGDTHVHSKWSDGTATIEEIAQYGDEFGHEWVIVCDHTKGLGVAGGLDEHKLRQRNVEIDAINASGRYKCRLLKGIEVEVKKDGSLDLGDDVLAECDYVIAAVHSGLDNVAEALARTVKALAHPLVHTVAHPTGRQFGKRDEGPLAPHFENIALTAAKHKKLLELNCDPGRLDLDEVCARKAASLGVTIAIGTDAHYLPEQLHNLRLGVGLARRGWLQASNVLNTLPLAELRKRLQR